MKRLLAFTLCATAAFAASSRPNIIFICTDDLGYGDVGVFYQNQRRESGDRSLPAHATPNLDRMAHEGARFLNHYVAAPVCVSSRSSLMQGVTQGHANVRDNQFDKAIDENHTLATVLHQAGYATAAIGKWGLHGGEEKTSAAPAHPLRRGFDTYYGYLRHIDGHEHYPKEALYFGAKAKRGRIVVWENETDATAPLDKCYTADLWTARAKKWITERAQAQPDQPFFLYLAYDTPHAVLELPTGPYPAGGGLKGGMQWLGTPGHAISTAQGTPDSWIHPDYAQATYDDDHNPATPEKPWPDVYRRYATSVRRIDDGVGDILQLLRDLHIDQNTLVVFISDNGPSIESYLPEEITPEFFASFGPFDGIKRDCWEGGVRTPTIAWWPGRVPADRVVQTPSGTWDWLPTFAAVAGLPAPARADGISLVPDLTGSGQRQPREYLYFEYQVNGRTPRFEAFEPSHRGRVRGQMQAIRKGDLMAVRYNIQGADDAFEIYNVTQDPKEAHDLGKTPEAAALQAEFKAVALQSRRPDPAAQRPYDAAPVPTTEAHATTPGLSCAAYEGNWPWVPAFATLTPTATTVVTGLDIGAVTRAKAAGLYFTGFLTVPADGEYSFTLRTDTGAELRLHDATVIDADYGYVSGAEKRATIKLKAGTHPIRLSYRHAAGVDPQLDLRWTTPGGSETAIPATAWRRADR